MAAKKASGDARQYLAQQIAAGHWSPSKGLDSYKSGYLNRMARQFRAQEAKGLTPNAQAARGHAITPEHPNRKSPGKTAYATGKRSKYVKAKRTAGGGGGGGGGRVIRRPRVHKRPNIPPIYPGGDRSITYTFTSESEALDLLEGKRTADGFQLRPSDRIVLSAYDCATGRWGTVFVNTKHSPGISASALYDQFQESGQSLEDFAMEAIDASDSDPYYSSGGGSMTHICVWQIFVYPRSETPRPPVPRPPRPTRPLRQPRIPRQR